MMTLLAAIRSVSPTSTPGATPAATPELIRDVAPPVDYFPYPTWMLVAAGIVAALLLGLVVWALVRMWTHRPKPAPPTPRAVALAALNKLRAQAPDTDPYGFSIAVSEVLRRFAEGQFSIPALEQTSPEFLENVSRVGSVSTSDRKLLGDFLERCDAIKFARIGGNATVNEALLASATAFVHGGRA